jgi:hypothetical protein
MGLDQRIVEVTNRKKEKKLIRKNLWTKYCTNGINEFEDGSGFMIVGNIFEEECSTTNDSVNHKLMKKDGFVIEKKFRKFNELQGWFDRNYNMKTLGNVRLTENNINKLLTDIQEDNLVMTEGFFYGDEPATQEEISELVETLNIVKKNIVDRNKIYFYTCWY